MRKLIVGISGASGVIYGVRMLEVLKEAVSHPVGPKGQSVYQT
jgi:3-polyprenyl-4-hydroxybenzoate decarboxylase